MIKFGESGHPVFRATSPLSRNAEKQRRWKIIHTIETVFRTIISFNQLSIYRAVSDLCEEYIICQTSTGRLIEAEQSDPFFAPADLLIMKPTPSTEVPAQENLWQKHKERVERLSQKDQLIKICIDAGFLNTVEVGQYFKNILTSYHNLQNQWHVVSILCHGMKNFLTRKFGFEGTPKLDPCQRWSQK